LQTRVESWSLDRSQFFDLSAYKPFAGIRFAAFLKVVEIHAKEYDHASLPTERQPSRFSSHLLLNYRNRSRR
jgi:hypothetical protein